MIKSILLFLTFIPILIFGQETKKITVKETNEKYFVLKSDKITKHGEYYKFSKNNKLLIKGFYKHGVKDSIWECYDLDGLLTFKYNFSNSEVVFYKPYDMEKVIKYRLIKGYNKIDTTLSRIPVFLGGVDFIRSVLRENIQYPKIAKENGKSGIVNVVFIVDKNGKTSNYHVDNPIGYGMDEEAIRALKLLPDNWLPGLINHIPVDVEIIYPVKYTLQ